MQTWQNGAYDWSWSKSIVSEVTWNISKPAYITGIGGTSENMRYQTTFFSEFFLIY